MLRVDRQQPPSSPPPRGHRQVAACDEALLVGEREVDAALERPERRRQAREADHRVQDDVRLGPLQQLGQVAAYLRERREAVDRGRARGGGDELELVLACDTSSAWRPIEPVAPRSAMRFMSLCPSRLREREHREVGGGAGEDNGVHAVEHAAVARGGCGSSPSRPGRASPSTRRGRRRRPRARSRRRAGTPPSRRRRSARRRGRAR